MTEEPHYCFGYIVVHPCLKPDLPFKVFRSREAAIRDYVAAPHRGAAWWGLCRKAGFRTKKVRLEIEA